MLLLKMPEVTCLSVEDTENAEKAIICYEQRQHYKEEMATRKRGKPCKRGSSLHNCTCICPVNKLDSVKPKGNWKGKSLDLNARTKY